MAIPIRTADVRRVFQPVLGTRFVTGTDLCDRVAEMLRRYAPGRTTLQELAQHIHNGIFSDLYELLGQHMTLVLDNGVYRRILLRDIDRLADEAMGVLLSVLPQEDLPLPMLRAYAMDTGSLVAMRMLLECHKEELSPMEQDVIRRILRENGASEYARPQ